MPEATRPDLLSLTPSDLRDALTLHFKERGQPEYRVRQVEEWIYQGLVGSTDQMTNLPAEVRADLVVAVQDRVELDSWWSPCSSPPPSD